MIRDDLSNKLIHLTKGINRNSPPDLYYCEAACNFLNIFREKKLRGSPGVGTAKIKGGFNCVCFSDAPVSKLGYILANPHLHGMKYAPFGVMVDKKWLFSKGGRPVIYQPDEEYKFLHENQQYRHMRFDLTPQNGNPVVDYSWEREWRIQTDELILTPEEVILIVPNRDWECKLVDEFYKNRKIMALGAGLTSFDDDGDFPWFVLVLEHLGMDIYDPDTVFSTTVLDC